MTHILFRNKILKEARNLNISNFFKLEEIPEQDFDKDIDTRINETLLRLNNLDINSITIPISVTENFLEFSGLRLGHHIRLSQELKFRKIAIIFIGTLEEKQLLKVSYLANILLTPNVHYVNITKFPFYKVQKSIEKLDVSVSEAFDFNKYLERVNIKPPANYESHHSIDNELTLMRWAEYLGITNQIPEVKNNLQSGLYFKYTRILNPIKAVEKGNPYLFQKKARIVLIDDQSDKGWKAFYDAFFKLSKHQIKFETLDVDYQLMESNDIVDAAERKVKDFNPDVVLLDLRLSDTDFDLNTEPKNLTGNKVLEKIKEFNQGIQVIIITASNKVWNYEVSLDLGSNGFIVKSAKSNVLEDIKILKNKIDLGIVRANYLKSAFKSEKVALNDILNAITENTIDTSFGNELRNFLEISLIMFEKAKTKESFAFAYLSLFKCIELIANYFIINESYKYVIRDYENLKQISWDNNSKEYVVNDQVNFRATGPTTFERLAGLVKQRWSYPDSEINDLYLSIDRRNKFIHPQKEKLNKFQQSNLNKIFNNEGFNLLLNQLERMTSNFNA